MYATGTFPVNSVEGAAPDLWATGVNNLSGGDPGQTVTAWAICRT